ncbi:hypothetical protein G7Z17_g9423 [Cylindrodendrum hubeiense]|uniref:Uncharacterized protein n=1 Tax=Cylindrodendrum hubeiense TaxID=595255 RepID=A0A9P5H986_9HYPO|nr:hypothetical protein G7Z17_g9423 [Cylindrodendrum hubeiense]
MHRSQPRMLARSTNFRIPPLLSFPSSLPPPIASRPIVHSPPVQQEAIEGPMKFLAKQDSFSPRFRVQNQIATADRQTSGDTAGIWGVTALLWAEMSLGLRMPGPLSAHLAPIVMHLPKSVNRGLH